MDSAPYLQAEDTPDFERILEELLQHDEIRQVLRRAPGAPGSSRLHSLALRDSGVIAAGASAEYAYYCEVREQVRSTAPVPDLGRIGGDDPAQWQAPENPLDAAERAGWVPLIAVLLPILSGLSAIVMLLLGYVIRAEHVGLGQPLVTAGFVAAVVCAASIAVDIIGLLLTAARDAANPPPGRNPELYAELARARDTWRQALRDRALLPYLLAQIGPPEVAYPRPVRPTDATPAAPARAPSPARAPARPTEGGPVTTTPGPEPTGGSDSGSGTGISLVRARPRSRLGYSSPGFTSPGAERISDAEGHDQEADPEAEPHFSSPGFTSPGAERISDGQGRDQEADPEAEPRFTSPGFTSPGPERLTDEEGREVEPDPEAEPHFTSPGFSRPSWSSSGQQLPNPRVAARSRSRFLPNADDLDIADADDPEGFGLDAVGGAAEAD
jgi:hypothetical protein